MQVRAERGACGAERQGDPARCLARHSRQATPSGQPRLEPLVRRRQDGRPQRGEHRLHDALVRHTPHPPHPPHTPHTHTAQWPQAPAPAPAQALFVLTPTYRRPCPARCAGYSMFTQLKSGFDTVLIDEAAQANGGLEPATQPLRKACNPHPTNPNPRPPTAYRTLHAMRLTPHAARLPPPGHRGLDPHPSQVRVPAAHPRWRPQPAARHGILGAGAAA